ncbi:MAG: DUF6515 family protein [Candidatus Omnitrophica bacterium]|nr:DUF6515 family protein [Candidatus Omnitrophota bacterium]
MNGVNRKRNFLAVLCAGLILLVIPSTYVFAHPGPWGSEGPHRGSEEVVPRHEIYRYRDGKCYRPVFFGLFEVVVDAPPVGAVIAILPSGHRTIIVGDLVYYYCDGVYYTACPSGFVVVPAPVSAPVTVVSSAAAELQKIPVETVTINVPNTDGSFTPVVLVKYQEGYLGPQGEYYPGHPTIKQLKVLYGK